MKRKSRHIQIRMEWGPDAPWPVLPTPLQEVAAGHLKVTASWPLVVHQNLGPPASGLPVVPLDARPHVTFRRPVHDDALVGVNPQSVNPEYERIGDPDRKVGPVRVRYSLKEVSLLRWNEPEQRWDGVAVAGRPPQAGERTLFGSWAPLPALPSGAGQTPAANDKLWVWSRTPFDYTRHGGAGLADWLASAHPEYPCVPQDVPDRTVCCDFERLDRSRALRSPWRSPEHPEITLCWPTAEPSRVTVLEPPVNGFIRALCFPPRGAAPAAQPDPARHGRGPGRGDESGCTPSTDSLTIALAQPARRVSVRVLEAPPPARVCLDFRNRPRAEVKLPLREQGVTVGPDGAGTTLAPTVTTLGEMTGLRCPPPSRRGAQGVIDLAPPWPAATADLLLTYQRSPLGAEPPTVTALDAAGREVAAFTLRNPAGQPERVHLEAAGLARVRVSGTGADVFLHQACFVPAPSRDAAVTAEGFDREGRGLGPVKPRDGVVEVRGAGLACVRVNGAAGFCITRICATFGPNPREVARRQAMAAHLQDEVARWQQEGEVLEPFSTYRLRIVTATDAYGEGELSGREDHPVRAESVDFRTEGPPGLAALSVPAGQDPARFESGLDDLGRYVRQTTPPTVPAPGRKPVMAKPFYRAYDVGVEFDEDYVDLMYRKGGRDLGLYLYDANGRPARGAGGVLLVESGEWGAAAELTLTDADERWLALSGGAGGCLPAIDRTTIPRQKTLTSGVAARVLAPDALHEARLVPLLLREGFRANAPGTAALGPGGALGRWRVRDESGAAPSRWEVCETPAPAARYVAQTAAVGPGPNDPGTVLLLDGDPALSPSHPEQPAAWTDYRLSAYVRSGSGGAVGLVFRYADAGNHYRVWLDVDGGHRGLASVAGGVWTVLASDDDPTLEADRDYRVTVEAVGTALRVYQDGALVFAADDASHALGSVGLLARGAAGARFADVRVDDFRPAAPVVYRFPFTTSRYASFFHHLHGYQDETWLAAVPSDPATLLALGQAVPPSSPATDDEARAYEKVAAAALGPAARQNPPQVQVTRVEVGGTALAFLVTSPEPLDWARTDVALACTPLVHTGPALPGAVKIVSAAFEPNATRLTSLVLLLREAADLTGYRVETRLAPWPLQVAHGVALDAQALALVGDAVHGWATQRVFGEEPMRAPGTTVEPVAGGSASAVPLDPDAPALVSVDAESLPPARRVFFGIEARVVAPDGTVVHARRFVPDAAYIPQPANVLRKADGTGFVLVPPSLGGNATPLPQDQYRLMLTFRRDNTSLAPGTPVWSQAGSTDPETVTLDIPFQAQ